MDIYFSVSKFDRYSQNKILTKQDKKVLNLSLFQRRKLGLLSEVLGLYFLDCGWEKKLVLNKQIKIAKLHTLEILLEILWLLLVEDLHKGCRAIK